jgi:hypothetical protein
MVLAAGHRPGASGSVRRSVLAISRVRPRSPQAALGIQAVYYLGGALLQLAAVIGGTGVRGSEAS